MPSRLNWNRKKKDKRDEAPPQKSLNSQSSASFSRQVRTSLHPLEEAEHDRRFREKGLSDSTDLNFEVVPVVRMSSTLYEGFSSLSSTESRYLFRTNTETSWKRFKVFLHSEQSVMFYTNIILAIFAVLLMVVSDNYLTNIDITRTFLNLETNKQIVFTVYSGIIMLLACICGIIYSVNTKRTLCYCMCYCMLFGGFLQFCLGIISINRKVDQQMLVKKEMKASFFSFGHEADITKRWNDFQIEFSCCGLYGINSYIAKKSKVPDSCYDFVCPQYGQKCQKIPHEGCYEIVKILEAKLLDPVILITQFCSVLQISNAILALNLLRPKPKARRYQVHYKIPHFIVAQK